MLVTTGGCALVAGAHNPAVRLQDGKKDVLLVQNQYSSWAGEAQVSQGNAIIYCVY